MVVPYGLKLAASIITHHFGNLVAKVCNTLLCRGALSLKDLVRFSDLHRNQVKNCLFVLIQHNCVQAFSVEITAGFREATATETLYTAVFDNIIHRLRFAKFLAVALRDSALAKNPQLDRPILYTLLEGLLEHGRLTFEQLSQYATLPGKAKSRDDLRTCFNRLVHEHYVERCPRPEPFISPNPEAATKKIAKFVVESPSIEQDALIAATLSDAERFSGITETEAYTKSDDKVIQPDVNTSAGDKRKYEHLEMGHGVQDVVSDVLWRINFEKLVNCVMRKAFVTNVRSRRSRDAGIVLEAMLESSRGNIKDMNSVASSMDNILKRLRNKQGNNSMTLEPARIIMEQLRGSLCTEADGAVYSIDLKGIIEDCRNDEVEALILKRYGKEASRIFRLLDKPCETDKISDITLFDKKDTSRILYKLWKDHFLNMERVVIPGQQHNFVWKVKKQQIVREHVLNDIYHAILNMSQLSQILEDISEADLSENVKLMALESSILKLDDALLMFHGS